MTPFRSLLFVPGSDGRKLAKSTQSGADALILDLEDSVPAGQKPAARELVAERLRNRSEHPLLFVRINDLLSGEALADLATVLPAKPDGIVLPKCESFDDVERLSHYLDALEASGGRTVGTTRIIAIVTETPKAVVNLAAGKFSTPHERLAGYMWGGEDLAAALGAQSPRLRDGAYATPFCLARDLCLFAASAAATSAIDAVFTGLNDVASLHEEAVAGRAIGFSAKAAIHPAQIAAIHEAYAPSMAEIVWARAVVQAFDGVAGAVRLDGRMLDRPHLVAARRMLRALPDSAN